VSESNVTPPDGPSVTEPGQSMPPKGRKPVLVLTAILLVAMLTGALYYRLDHPTLSVQKGESRAAAPSETQEHGEPVDRDPKAMQEIMELMQHLQENPHDSDALLALSGRFMEMKAWDQSRDLLTRLLVTEPSNTSALRMLGVCLFELKDYATSAQTFETVLALGDKDAEAHFNLGILYARFLDNADKGKEHFEAVLNVPGANTEAREMARHALEELFSGK
jgi:cytochrome c-type biogenesis protein CcmH/NrfG